MDIEAEVISLLLESRIENLHDGKAAEYPANLANEERFERTDELQDIEAIKVCQSMVESIVEKVFSHRISLESEYVPTNVTLASVALQ